MADGLGVRRVENSESVARYSFLNEFKGDETAGDSGLFLCQKRLAADECAFLKTDRPVRIGFKWRRVFVHVVAIEQIAHLQPEEIPRAEPSRFKSPGSSLVDKQVPEAPDLIRVDVNLIAQFTGVAGPGKQAGKITDHGLTGVMELESFKRFRTKTHEQLARLWSLNSHLGQFD